MSGPRRPPHDRAAWALFAAHAALIALSTVALTTFLAGDPPAWLATPASQRALRLGWAISGPAYVTLGALAALLHAAGRLGWRRALAMLGIAAAVSLGAELVGTRTGYPFGAYAYTPLLGYRIGGRVPFPIPLSWFYMVFASLALVARIVPTTGTGARRTVRALAAGVVLTAWDVAMDPAMVRTAHWVWRADGFFYGMPLTNWAGWLLTGTVIAWLVLGVAPARELERRVAPSRFALALYAANGLFPIAICARHGLWWAAAGGAAAMGIVLGAASLAPALAARARATTPARRATRVELGDGLAE